MQHTVSYASLDNGAEGLFIDIPSASVTSIDFVFRAGDYLSPKGKTDTAHIMEHLVLGANTSYPSSRAFSKEFTKYGAYNNAYTGDYHMGYEAECEAGETERIVDLLCIAIESPLFTKEDFKAEVGNVREELKMRRNNNDSELALCLESAMGFVPKSYTERAKELSAISLEDIVDHYKRTHTTTNIRFVIAGPIADLIPRLSSRISSLALPKGSGRIELPAETPRQLKKPLLMENPHLDNTCYRWEVVLPAFASNLERDSLNALHDLLFSGFHSKVFGELREKGLVYGIFGSYYETKNNAVAVVHGQVQPDNIQMVFSILQREISLLAEHGVTEDDLDDLKKRMFGEMQRYTQTPGQLNNWYRHPFVLRGEIVPFTDFKNRVDAITSDSIKEAALRILKANIQALGCMHVDTTLPVTELYDVLRGAEVGRQ